MSHGIPFERWGHVTAPEAAGSFVLIARETSDGWKNNAPEDAVRVWVRRPGEPDDSECNWTTWLHEAQLPEWLSSFAIDKWLEPGEDPDWS